MQTQGQAVGASEKTVGTRTSTGLLIRMVAVHAAVVLLVALVVLVPLLTVAAGLNIGLPIIGAVVVAVAVTLVRIRNIDDRIARQIGARPLGPADGDAEPAVLRLLNLAESVAMAAGIAAPKVHLIDAPGRNAITWGASNGAPSIAVTTGLLDVVDRLDLESVLAHQATMVNDRPVDVITLGAALFGPVAKGPLARPLAQFVHTNTDPRSIVLSDIEGARATRYPPGMVAALEKLLGQDTLVPAIPEAFSGLCFVTPVHEPGPFALHPPLEDRIDLMREM